VPAASQRTHRLVPGTSNDVIHVARQTRIVIPATIRLPNSMYEWKPCVGNGCPGWQPGQCSQPRPEPVSLTVVPLATTTISITTFAVASRRNVRAGSASPRRRGNDVSIPSL
jgi:hypothetical protein